MFDSTIDALLGLALHAEEGCPPARKPATVALRFGMAKTGVEPIAGSRPECGPGRLLVERADPLPDTV